MDRLRSMRAYCKVVEAGGFTQAAQDLQASVATVSKLVSDLERHLGVRLLQRSTRHVTPTEIGLGFHTRCQAALDLVDDAEALVRRGQQDTAGRIKLLVSFSEGLKTLAPRWVDFQRKHPDLALDVHLEERVVDLVEEGFDLAIQPQAFIQSNTVVARPLTQSRLVVCAAPAYLQAAGEPPTVAALAGHRCISLSHDNLRSRWTLVHEEDHDDVQQEVDIPCVLSCNHAQALVDACVSGLGIALVPEDLVRTQLAMGQLQRVLPGYASGTMRYFLVYPSRQYLPRKVRVAIDFILASFGQVSASPLPEAAVLL